jgi:hypothetical protein
LTQTFIDYYACPPDAVRLATAPELSGEQGYFAFAGNVCYGRRAAGQPAVDLRAPLSELASLVGHDSGKVVFPFDLSEVVTNLREERYDLNGYPVLERLASTDAVRHLYYFLRPLLNVSVRKHLQRIRLSGWEDIQFPRWPVDTTVDRLMEHAMAMLLANGSRGRIPFIWFWPKAARACAIMTHDVEGDKGRRFCDELMDLDESFGVKSAFQLIPQGQEAAGRQLASRIRARGFEANLHDLNHDGYLFYDQRQFRKRAKEINRYAREFECQGFRAGAMYREQQWYDAFEFAYDMSVPNVAHLEPQRGGCCTVMPYFVGNILELPLTTLQDYSLFHILNDYSITLWKQQIELIRERNGLMTFLTHPDYLTESRAQRVYTALLSHLQELRAESHVWIAVPAEVDLWWRSRRRMRLVPDGDSWRIEGPGADRASLAYAVRDGDAVRFELDPKR